MKIISSAAFIFFFLASPAIAQNKHSWTAADTAMQSAFIVLVFIDWQQTREFTGKPDKYPTKYESNPLLKAHPSAREVNRVVATCALLHTGIAYALPRPYRTIWQGLWIGVEAEAVTSNYKAGIKFDFP